MFGRSDADEQAVIILHPPLASFFILQEDRGNELMEAVKIGNARCSRTGESC